MILGSGFVDVVVSVVVLDVVDGLEVESWGFSGVLVVSDGELVNSLRQIGRIRPMTAIRSHVCT